MDNWKEDLKKCVKDLKTKEQKSLTDAWSSCLGKPVKCVETLPYLCPVKYCGKRFTHKESLVNHMSKVHVFHKKKDVTKCQANSSG